MFAPQGFGRFSNRPSLPLFALTLLGISGATISVTEPGSRVAVPLLGALGLAVTFVLLRAVEDPEDRVSLAPLVLAAIGVRLVVYIGVRQTLGPYVFAPDAWAYEIVGSEIVQAWDGLRAMPEKATSSLQVGYYYLNAFLQRTFGPSPAAPALINVFFGSWAVIPTFLLAKLCVRDNRGVARWAAILVAFFPSLVLWSVLNIREAPTILAVVSALYFFVKFGRVGGVSSLVFAAGSLVVVMLSREYLTALLGMAVPAGYLMSRGKSAAGTMAGGVVLLTLGVAGLSFGGFGATLVAEPTLDTLEYLRKGMAAGAGSAYGMGHDVSTVGGAARFLPLGLAYFLFAPFPWQAGSLLQMVTVPEVLVWYALLPFTIRGLALGLRKDPRSFMVIVAVLVTVTVAYALVQGNVGTAFRHRAQILPMVFVFTSVGIRDWYGARLESKRFARRRRREVSDRVHSLRGGAGLLAEERG